MILQIPFVVYIRFFCKKVLVNDKAFHFVFLLSPYFPHIMLMDCLCGVHILFKLVRYTKNIKEREKRI